MKHNMQSSSRFFPHRVLKQEEQRYIFWLQKRIALEGYSQQSNFQNLSHLYWVTVSHHLLHRTMLHSVFSTALCICMQFLRPAVVIFISVLLNNTSYRMIPFYLLYFILPSQIFFLLSLSLAVFMQYLFQSSSSLCAYVNGLTNIPLAFLFRAVCVNG